MEQEFQDLETQHRLALEQECINYEQILASEKEGTEAGLADMEAQVKQTTLKMEELVDSKASLQTFYQ